MLGPPQRRKEERGKKLIKQRRTLESLVPLYLATFSPAVE